MQKISVTILTKNSGATLGETLQALQRFPQIVIFDTGSTDNTLEIAAKFPNVTIHQAAFRGFGPAHNEATALASYDWILSIDSDEVLTPALLSEIATLQLDTGAVYSIQRDNYFNGKQIRCCAGWYPDPVIRLYNRKKTKFSEDAVHEKILAQGLKVIPLLSSLKHTPYRTIADFLDKMQRYSTLFAQQNQGRKKSSFFITLIHTMGAFFKSYILKRGIFGGKEGYIISVYNAQTTYYKYLKLAELNKNL